MRQWAPLKKGKLADMTIFDEKFDVKMTFVGGGKGVSEKKWMRPLGFQTF